MASLVVDPRAGCWSGDGKPIDGNPGEDLVVGPGIIVSPVVEFFVDPGEESDGTVVETVTEGLGLRGLLLVVTETFFGEPFTALDAGFLEV